MTCTIVNIALRYKYSQLVVCMPDKILSQLLYCMLLHVHKDKDPGLRMSGSRGQILKKKCVCVCVCVCVGGGGND